MKLILLKIACFGLFLIAITSCKKESAPADAPCDLTGINSKFDTITYASTLQGINTLFGSE